MQLTDAFFQNISVPLLDPLIREVDPSKLIFFVNVDSGIVEDEIRTERGEQ